MKWNDLIPTGTVRTITFDEIAERLSDERTDRLKAAKAEIEQAISDAGAIGERRRMDGMDECMRLAFTFSIASRWSGNMMDIIDELENLLT